MTSTERAPEPTMEEILASIRRIISDDESGATRQRSAATSHQDEEGLEVVDDEADDKIINDIARVLSGATPPAEEEDILDLTAELGGLEPVEELLMVEVAAEPALAETPAGAQQEPLAAEAAASPQTPDLEPVAPPPPLSASEEAASALERAIAALRAGQLPTSVPGFAAQFDPAPQPEPPAFLAQPEPEPEPEFAPEPELEPELVLTEFEAEIISEELVTLDTQSSEDADAPAWEAEAPSFGAAVAREAEQESPRTNGGGAHQPYYPAAPSPSPLDASAKTLEDSVKDMLRPLLRQWLDENMARVLTSALQEELKDNPARLQRD